MARTSAIAHNRDLTVHSRAVAVALLVVGLLATASAWKDRQPSTTADFTALYASAAQSTAEMYAPAPGPYRRNMNPPHFQLLLRPLTAFPLPVAAVIFRALNIISLCGCLLWLSRAAKERWDVGDLGVLLAWAPMASMLSLNQIAWILWPLLLWTWSSWRQERWTSGAIAYGIALSFKPFLGVLLLWLIVTKQWRAVLASLVTATAACAVGLLVYGADVGRAWVAALADVTWTYAPMNASLQGLLSRAFSAPASTSLPFENAPLLITLLGAAAAAVIVAATLRRTRSQHLDDAWLPLVTSSLLASPLGWIYYVWWILPGARPSRLLFEAPLLWIPMVATTYRPNVWVTMTLGSVYFWGLFGLWARRMRTVPG